MARRRSLLQRCLTPDTEIPHATVLTAGIVIWVLVVGGWAVLSYGGITPSMFLPTPGAVVAKAVKLAESGLFFQHMWASIEVVMLGFIISSLVAVPLGLLMGTFRIVQAALEPLVNFIRYLPVTSFVPLFILWIGIGIEQRVTVIFFGTFFSQLVMIADEARAVSRDLLSASYTLGTKRNEAVWHVIFPA